MSTRKLARMLRDDRPIGYTEIAGMLGISIETVKRWHPDSTSRLRTRLPAPDAPPEVGPRGGLPGPRWRTATIAAWATDPVATGSGRVYLDPRTGAPTTQPRATVTVDDAAEIADEGASAGLDAARLRIELDAARRAVREYRRALVDIAAHPAELADTAADTLAGLDAAHRGAIGEVLTARR